MASDRLFGNDITPACKYCTEAFQQMANGHIFCMKRGIMPPDHSCKKFLYDPVKRIPSRPKPLEKFSEEDFRI